MTYIQEAPHAGKPDNGLSPAMAAMHADLCALIRVAQQETPFHHVGQVWAEPVSQDGWCRASGLKLRTFQELVRVPPIRRYQCNLEGGKVTLLRVGDPGPEQDRIMAKQMEAYYLAATKEPTISGKEFGCLCGLACDWPDGWQMDTFKHTVIRWPDFMDHVKMEVALAIEARDGRLDPFHPDALCDPLLATARRFWGQGERLDERVYQRPFILLLRAFWPVALELFIDGRQFRGDAHPARVWHRWSEQA